MTERFYRWRNRGSLKLNAQGLIAGSRVMGHFSFPSISRACSALLHWFLGSHTALWPDRRQSRKKYTKWNFNFLGLENFFNPVRGYSDTRCAGLPHMQTHCRCLVNGYFWIPSAAVSGKEQKTAVRPDFQSLLAPNGDWTWPPRMPYWSHHLEVRLLPCSWKALIGCFWHFGVHELMWSHSVTSSCQACWESTCA